MDTQENKSFAESLAQNRARLRRQFVEALGICITSYLAGVASSRFFHPIPGGIALGALLLVGTTSLCATIFALTVPVSAFERLQERPGTPLDIPSEKPLDASPDSPSGASPDADLDTARNSPPKASPGAHRPRASGNSRPALPNADTNKLTSLTPEEIDRAIRRLKQAKNQKIIHNFQELQTEEFERIGLTEQEQFIARLLLKGGTYEYIGEQVFLSESTIKYHANSILQKANVASRQEFSVLIHERMEQCT